MNMRTYTHKSYLKINCVSSILVKKKFLIILMVHIQALSEMVFLNTAIQRLSYHVSKTVANIFLSFVFFPLGIESGFKTKK